MTSTSSKTKITFVIDMPLYREVSFKTFKREFASHLGETEAQAVWETMVARAKGGEIVMTALSGLDLGDHADSCVDTGAEIMSAFESHLEDEIAEIREELKEQGPPEPLDEDYTEAEARDCHVKRLRKIGFSEADATAQVEALWKETEKSRVVGRLVALGLSEFVAERTWTEMECYRGVI